MIDFDQDSPNEPAPPDESAATESSLEQDGAGGDPDHAPDHSAEGSEFQADFPARLAKRTAEIDALLSQKEQHVMSYVFAKVPKPFYERWKKEANQVFSLRVRLKNRASGG